MQEPKNYDLDALLKRSQNRLAGVQTPDAKPQEVPEVATPPAGPVETPGMRFANPAKMLENAPESFYNNVKAVLWDLPVVAVKQAYGAVVDPKQYWDDLKLAVRTAPEIGGMVAKDFERRYWGDAANELEKNPFDFVSDAAGLATAGAGLSAGVAGKGAKLTKILGAVAGADPAEIALKIGMRLPTKAAMKALGITPETAELRALNAMLGAQFEKEGNAAAGKVFLDGLNDVEKVKLVEAWADGEKGFIERMKVESPKAYEMYEKSREWLLDDERHWTAEEALIKGKMARDAKVKAHIRINKQKGIDVSYDDAIKRIYVDKTHDPTFFSIFSDPPEKGFFSSLTDPIYRDGSLSRAEARAMQGEIPTDPYQILSRQIRASIAAKKAIALHRGSMSILSKKGLLKAVDDTTDVDALRKAGYAPLEGPFYEKYHDTFGRAVNHIADAARKPGDVVQNVTQAAEEFKDLAMRAENNLTNPVRQVWAPEGIAKWLKMELSPGFSDTLMGKLGHAFTNAFGAMPYYKAIATVFNPRYWLANAVGGAALTVLYGIHPQSLKYARKLKELLPDELQHFATHDLFLRDLNWFKRKAQNLRHYAAAVDAYFKNSIYVSEAIKDGIKRGLLDTGAAFYVAEEKLKPLLAELRAGGMNYNANLIEIRKITERLVTKATLQAQLNTGMDRTGALYSSAAAREGGEGKSMNDPVYGPRKLAHGPDEVYGPKMGNAYEARKNRVNEAAVIKALDAGEERMALLTEAKAKVAAGQPFDARAMSGFKNWKDLESRAFSPAAFNRMVDEMLGKERQQAAKLVGLLENPQGYTFTRKKELPTKTMGDDIYGGGTVKKDSEIYPSLEQSAKSKAQGHLTERAQKHEALAMKKQQNEADAVDLYLNRASLEAQSEPLKIQADRYESVVKAANNFFGSYARMTPFERKIVAELIPFYPFAQAMTRLAFRLPFMYPARHMFYLGLWRMWQDVMEEQSPRSTWAKHYTPIMGTADGNGFIAVRHGAWNPMNSFRFNPVGDLAIPSAWDFLSQNPLIRVFFNAKGQMQAKPASPGETGVRLDNGEVWRWEQRGGWKRVVATPSFLKQITSLFPQSQILESLFYGAAQSDQGSILWRDDVKGRDGQPLFPLSWKERALSTLVPTTNINFEELDMRERRKLRTIKRQFLKEIRTANPQRRDAIFQLFQHLDENVDKHYLDYGGG